LVIVAVTVTVPAAVVFRVLPLKEVPVPPSVLTDQVMVWFVALDGATVPVKVSGVPAVAVVGTPVIFVTGINAAFTVMVKSLV
jgi:hypothetical protein